MRSKLFKKLMTSSIEQVKPLEELYEWLDLIDLHNKVFKLPCKYTAPSGEFPAEVVSVHKCFYCGKHHYVFFFEVQIPKYGKTYFQTTTPIFETQDESNYSLSDLLEKLQVSELINSDESILQVAGKKLRVVIEPFYDFEEKCIAKFLSLSAGEIN